MYIVCLVDLYIGPGTFDGKLVSSCEISKIKEKTSTHLYTLLVLHKQIYGEITCLISLRRSGSNIIGFKENPFAHIL
jgi:hypothetical protein